MSMTVTPAQLLQQDRLRWPGMLPREILIFKAWLAQFGNEFDTFDFNRRIGAGHDPGPNWPQYIRDMAIANSQLRIDAVGMKGPAVSIIEVKDRAGAAAVGQLVTYDAVWQEDFPNTPTPALILVTNRVQPNILPLIRKSAIRLDVVQTDFSSLANKTFYPGYSRKNRSG
jgi:hypothetical protein